MSENQSMNSSTQNIPKFTCTASQFNFNMTYVDLSPLMRTVLSLDPYIGGGTLSYRQAFPSWSSTGEVFVPVQKASFPFQGLHWTSASVYISGHATAAKFTLGVHVSQQTVESIVPSQGSAGTRVYLTVVDFPDICGNNVDLNNTWTACLFVIRFGSIEIQPYQTQIIALTIGSVTISFIVPNFGSINEDLNVNVSVWSQLSGALAVTAFVYNTFHEDYGLSLGFESSRQNFASNYSPQRALYGSVNSTMFNQSDNTTQNFGNFQRNLSITSSEYCNVPKFCAARGLAAKPAAFYLPSSFCNPELDCFSASTVVSLTLIPFRTSPEYVIGGETIVSAEFTNCIATEVGQVLISVVLSNNYAEVQVPLIGLVSRPSPANRWDIQERPWQCEIVFQAPVLARISNCTQVAFQITVDLGGNVQQQADFSLQYVQKPTSSVEIVYPSRLYLGTTSIARLRLFNDASYSYPQDVILNISGRIVENVLVVKGVCRNIYLMFPLNTQDVDSTSGNLSVSIMSIYNNNGTTESSTFSTLNELIVFMPVETAPAITLQNPLAIRSEAGGAMIFQVKNC